MKTKKMLAIGLITVAVITSCGKKTLPPPPDELNSSNALLSQNSDAQFKGMRKIKQANLNLSNNDWIKYIKEFKQNQSSNEVTLARFSNSDSLTLDSANTLIEAALNYDYNNIQEGDQGGEFVNRSFIFNLDDNSLKISTSTAESIFSSISLSIDSLLNDTTYVNVVDLESYVYDPGTGQGIVNANVSVSRRITGNQCNSAPFNNCSCTWVQSWPGMWWSLGYFGSGCNYNSYPSIFSLNTYANCIDRVPQSCDNAGFFYTNLSQVSILPPLVGTNNTGLLRQSMTVNDWCTSFLMSTYMPKATANGYHTTIVNYVNNYNLNGNLGILGTIYIAARIDQNPNITNEEVGRHDLTFISGKILCKSTSPI